MKYAVALAWFALLAGPVSVFAAEKKIPRYEGKPLEYWVERLQKAENEEDQETAGLVLIGFGPDAAPAVPTLIEMLDDHSEKFRRGIATILGEIGPAARAAAPAMVKAFKKSKDWLTRDRILDALSKIDPHPDQIVPVLLLALGDDHYVVKEAAMGYLRKIGPPAKAALPELRKVLKSDTPKHRAMAARALWSIQGDSQAVAILSLLLGYEDEQGRVAFDGQVTYEAVEGLGEVGPAAKEALPQLKKKLADCDRYVRKAAVEAIRKIDPKEGRKLKLDDDGIVTVKGVGKIEIAKPKP